MTELHAKTRKAAARIKRTRAHSKATADRPKLIVSRSNRYIYAQVIDQQGKVVAAAHSMKSKQGVGKAAPSVGQQVATIAKEKGVTKVAFDRRGNKYHGNIKALADAAREGGLNF